MKSILIVLSILVSTATIVLGQSGELRDDQKQSVQKLINLFKAKNKTKIADMVSYPLRREYPLKDVKNKNNFIQRFDELFDKAIIDQIAKSKITDWSEVGWRGITLGNGTIWVDDDGNIIAVNYQSAKEKILLAAAIKADKSQLPASLQNFKNPVYLIFTKNYKIRIDETADGVYRYAAWKIKNRKTLPDIVIENGTWEFQGSGGNHTVTFTNNGYTYIVSVFVINAADEPDASIEVIQQEKAILTEDGRIIRN